MLRLFYKSLSLKEYITNLKKKGETLLYLLFSILFCIFIREVLKIMK